MILTWNDDGSCTVQSPSGNTYHVKHSSPGGDENVHVWTCDCPAGQHGRDCKHVKAVIADAQRLAEAEGT